MFCGPSREWPELGERRDTLQRVGGRRGDGDKLLLIALFSSNGNCTNYIVSISFNAIYHTHNASDIAHVRMEDDLPVDSEN